jgi:beta-glucosidase
MDIQVPHGSGSALDAALSLDELADLTAGADFWHSTGNPHAGVRQLSFSDGPNGVRGDRFDERAPSLCTPCGSALGATWDRDLARSVGQLIGSEAALKGVDVVLGPVLNITRTPLGGRSFECFSEDPLLAGELGAAWIVGVQSRGVAATPKHFVANDAEADRWTVDCVVDERTLREIYLPPFEWAVRAGAWVLMTAYNRVNGLFCAEQAELVAGLLKGEWGWDGVVVSDWFATHGAVDSVRGGLDLEMPGPARHFGAALADAVRDGRVELGAVTRQIDRLRRLSRRVRRGPVRRSLPEAHELLRVAAASSFVLLKNETGLLPLDPDVLRRVAVVGPNADHPAIQGGGASHVAVEPRPSPVDAIRAAVGDRVEVVYEPGCPTLPSLPPLERLLVRALPDVDDPSSDGRTPGFTIEYLTPGDQGLVAAAVETRTSSFLWILGRSELAPDAVAVRCSTRLTPSATGMHLFGVRATGSASLAIDGATLLSTSGPTSPEPDPIARTFVGGDRRCGVVLEEGRSVLVTVEMELQAFGSNALAISGIGPRPSNLLSRAVDAAASADVAVVVVGTNSETECEGVDRESTRLPAEQEDLIRAVCAANPRTVVVVNAGGVVDVAWADDVPALVYAWFGGQEMGPALAGVLLGELEPGGRLPVSLGRPDDYPAWDTAPDAAGFRRYGEGVFVGYRHFDRADLEPYFCFGHGEGYSTFEYESLDLRRRGLSGDYEAFVRLRNAGSRRSKEVIQLYVAGPASRVLRPPRELRAFESVVLDPGETADIPLALDPRAFSYWDDQRHRWALAAGLHTVEVGRSSRDIRLRSSVELEVAREQFD